MALSDLTASEQTQLDRTLRAAESRSRIEFSIWTGRASGEPRAFAQGLHAQLNAPEHSTLFMVDRIARSLEVVTGSRVRAKVPDEVVAAVVAGMVADLADGDLLGALTRGMNEIADAVR